MFREHERLGAHHVANDAFNFLEVSEHDMQRDHYENMWNSLGICVKFEASTQLVTITIRENYVKIIDYHLKNGTNGVVPGGTTGESPTISHDEHKNIIKLAVNECKGKIPVISGTGSNSTDEGEI